MVLDGLFILRPGPRVVQKMRSPYGQLRISKIYKNITRLKKRFGVVLNSNRISGTTPGVQYPPHYKPGVLLESRLGA